MFHLIYRFVSQTTKMSQNVMGRHCCDCAPSRTVKSTELLTTVKDARRFMIDCLKATGVSQEHAEIVSDNLLEADFRGHYSHGLNRLEMYIRDIQMGTCNPNAKCTVEKETIATALVNGNNGLGAVVGKFCMDLAIKKAKDVGIAMVVVHGSNHFGIAGMYALQAIKQGMIGLCFSNTSPFMAPTRAKESAMGNNPLALGAPALKGDSFVLDMALTVASMGKIELARRKGEPIPKGWALNSEGKMETDPEEAIRTARLVPLGGTEGNAAYGLSLLVEILCGILSGSKYGPYVRKWDTRCEVADLGQAFIAINPKVFACGFGKRMSELMCYLRKMEPADPGKPVLVHGDPERRHMEKVKKDGGFLYVQNQHETNAKLAEELNVKPMVSTASTNFYPECRF